MLRAGTTTVLAKYLASLLAVAACYYVTGRLGLLLAIPPGFATAIWPPSGIALAAVLVLGYGLWPGVLLGSFLLNLSIADNQLNGYVSLLLPLTIALGASLQAVFSAWLVRKVTRFPNPVEQIGDVLAVLLLGGVIGSLVNCSISTAALYGVDSISAAALGFAWFTWWVGDVIGVIVFTPFLLLLFAPSSMVNRPRKAMLSAIFMMVFIIVVYAFTAARELDVNSRRSGFEHVVEEVQRDTLQGFSQYFMLLFYVEGLFAASETVTLGEFNEFAQHVLLRQPSVRALIWSPLITHADRAGFEASMRAQGLKNFVITERDENYTPRLAGERAFYFPVAYLAPQGINPQAIGTDNYAPYDMNAAARRAAMDSARAARSDRISGRLIMHSAGDDYGVAIYRPVFLSISKDLQHSASSDHLAGYIMGTFQLRSVFSDAESYLKASGLEMTVSDITDLGAPVMLYDSRTPGRKESPNPLPIPAQSLTGIKDLDIGGRRWQMRFSESPAHVSGLHGWGPWAVLVGGMAFTSLLSAFLLIVSGRAQIVQRLVDEKTREVATGLEKLAQANQELSGLYEITKEKEQTFRLAMEHALVGTALVKPDGHFMSVNRALCDILGYSAAELETMDFATITHPEDLPEDNRNLAALLSGEIQTYRMEKRYFHKNGRVVWALLSVSLVRDSSGRPLYCISQIDDITGLKTAEEKGRQLVDSLTKSNTELERFAYVASHDMQEPLRMIGNFSELINREQGSRLDDDGRQYLKLVMDSVRRMQEMVTDLLEYARIGSNPVANAAVDMRLEMGHVLQNLNSSISQSGAEVVYGGLPGVIGNPVQIASLLQNLISNGIKYQPAGARPKISVTATDAGDMWEFTVADNGIGIPESAQQKIFEPFTRLHSWQQYQGTGIGLAVCRKIIENHGGRIWVISGPGQGAAFHFTLKKAVT